MPWFDRSYRPNAWPANQQATCRYCDQRLTWAAGGSSVSSTYGLWLHEGYTRESWEIAWTAPDRPESLHTAEPKEFCMEPMGDSVIYHYCGRPVRYENITAGDFACGIHIKQMVADKKRAEANRKWQEERKQKEEIEEFEAVQYQAAADQIREMGFPMLVEGYVAKERYSRLHKTTDVDVCVLRDWLVSIVEEISSLKSEVQP